MLTYIKFPCYNGINLEKMSVLLNGSSLIDLKEIPYADRRGVPTCSTHDGIQREGLEEVPDLVGR